MEQSMDAFDDVVAPEDTEVWTADAPQEPAEEPTAAPEAAPVPEPVVPAYVPEAPAERVRFGGYDNPALQKARLEGGAVNKPLEGPATPFTPPKAGR